MHKPIDKNFINFTKSCSKTRVIITKSCSKINYKITKSCSKTRVVITKSCSKRAEAIIYRFRIILFFRIIFISNSNVPRGKFDSFTKFIVGEPSQA